MDRPSGVVQSNQPGSVPGASATGSPQTGAIPTGAIPTGAASTDAVPTGSPPAGSAPAGAVSAGAVPTGALPIGALATGALPGLPELAPGATPVAVSYTVTKAGWRRRTLRVQVRSNGPVPELVLVARSGSVPPETTADGHVLSGLPPASGAATRTIEVTLEGAQLPWGIRLLPLVGPGSPPVWVDHPADSALVIR